MKVFFEQRYECITLLNANEQKFSAHEKLNVLKSQVTLYAAVNEININDILDDVLFNHTSIDKDI